MNLTLEIHLWWRCRSTRRDTDCWHITTLHRLANTLFICDKAVTLSQCLVPGDDIIILMLYGTQNNDMQ